MKVCLTVLMGLPGSGKTTFAKTLKNNYKDYNGSNYSFVHVCYDELLPYHVCKTHESETKWKDMRMDIVNTVDQLLRAMVEKNFDKIPSQFINQFDSFDPVTIILIDDNMFLKSMRYAYYKKAKEYNISFCQIYLKSSLEQCIDRNLSRSEPDVVPVSVIIDMNNKIECPNLNNNWERHTLVFEIHSDNGRLYDRFFSLVNEALNDPEIGDLQDEMEKEKSLMICMTNVLHQIDITSRQIVRNRIQKYIAEVRPDKTSGEFETFCQGLNKVKGRILNGVRLGEINVPETVLTEIRENIMERCLLNHFVEQVFDNYMSSQ